MFYCPGGFCYEKMSLKSKLMMKMFRKVLESNKNRTPSDELMIKMISSSYDISGKKIHRADRRISRGLSGGGREMSIEYRRLAARDIQLALGMNADFRERLIDRAVVEKFLNDERNWLFAAIHADKVVGFAYGYRMARRICCTYTRSGSPTRCSDAAWGLR